MNPYEADPQKIPAEDLYSDVPLYGRYHPQPDDFVPDPQHVGSASPEAVTYWLSVLSHCTPANRIYEDRDGGRDVFALGTVIVKSSHLRARLKGRRAKRDYSFADRNEVAATALARPVLGPAVRVPHVYFAGKINSRPVLVQERIPGVGLTVAWPYLTQDAKESFKEQARGVLRQLHAIKSPAAGHGHGHGDSGDCGGGPAYVAPDPDPVGHRGIQELERALLFPAPAAAADDDDDDTDLGLMHNDFSPSNCIVDDGRIVGLVDWEMAGFFAWRAAAGVHVRIRSPRREYYAALGLSEEFLCDLLFWNDLYEVEP